MNVVVETSFCVFSWELLQHRNVNVAELHFEGGCAALLFKRFSLFCNLFYNRNKLVKSRDGKAGLSMLRVEGFILVISVYYVSRCVSAGFVKICTLFFRCV